MPVLDRIKLYKEVEKHRECPLLVYVTSKRSGVEASMASDVLPYIIDQIQSIEKKEKKLDILIASLGGNPMVAWHIMALVNNRFDEVDVLIPQSAYSAATLLALGAKQIIMHPYANLGPVDMQITALGESGFKHFSTEDIVAFFEYVRDELHISEQEHLRKLFQEICKEIGPLNVGLTARGSHLAISLGQKLLAWHHPEKDNPERLKGIVESLSKEFHTHGYPVSRKEAIDIGLQVKQEPDEKLDDLMWKIWLDIEDELKERTQAIAIVDLLDSAEGHKLLSPVPLLNLPLNAAGPTMFNADIKSVTDEANRTQVKPVDFTHTLAVLESQRLAVQNVSRGKILASRMPDLTIQLNALPTFRGWESRNIV